MTKTEAGMTPPIINADDLPLDSLYQSCEEAVSDGVLLETLSSLGAGAEVPAEIQALLQEVVRATIEVAVNGTVRAVNEFLMNKTNQ